MQKLILLAILLSSCSFLSISEEDESKIKGERIAILANYSDIKANISIANMNVKIPNPVKPIAWPIHGGNSQHHIENIDGNYQFIEKQTVKIGDGNSWEGNLRPNIVSSPTIIYAMDSKGIISAHDIKNIKNILWKSNKIKDSEFPLNGGGLAVNGRYLYAATASGIIAAFNPKTGEIAWKYKSNYPIRSAPTLKDGKLFIITAASHLLAINAKTGKIIWQHNGIIETASMLDTVSPSVANGVVIAAYPSGEIYGLSERDGRILWIDSIIAPNRTSAMGILSGAGAAPVITGNLVINISSNGLLAVNHIKKGMRLWERRISSYIDMQISDKYLYLVDTNNELLSIYIPDGQIKWIAKLDKTAQNIHMINGKILVMTNDEWWSFSPKNGKLISHHKLVGSQNPAFTENAIYIIDKNAILHEIN